MNLSQLEEYIEIGDASAIDRLLENNPTLCQDKTSHDISPLLLACYYNKHQIVKVILKHTQSISVFEAAAAGLADVVTELIEEEPSTIDSYSDHGFTILGLAVHFGNTDVVRYLLRKGADTNLSSRNGYAVYPLHTAIGADYEEISKMLVEAGAAVNVAQASGMTPLHLAAQNGNIELLILLLESGAHTNVQNEFGKKPADLAAEKGFKEIADILA